MSDGDRRRVEGGGGGGRYPFEVRDAQGQTSPIKTKIESGVEKTQKK